MQIDIFCVHDTGPWGKLVQLLQPGNQVIYIV